MHQKKEKSYLKKSKPWYNDDLRQLHRDVRRREMIWEETLGGISMVGFQRKAKYVHQASIYQ